MSRRSGNSQTEAAQGTHSPSAASGHTRKTGPVPYLRFVEVSQTVTPLPTAPKSSVASIPNVQRIRFVVGHNPRWRDSANPAGSSLPGPDRVGIVHANRSIIFDDAASSFGDLPFQGGACQAFSGRTFPDVAPKVLSALGPFTRLNPGGHAFEFIPCLRRMAIPVLPEQIGSILENATVRMIGHSHHLGMKCVAGDQFGIL